MDNEFFTSPLLKSDVHRPKIDPKQQIIKGLREKNEKLKSEIKKFQNAIQQKSQADKWQANKKRQSLFQTEDNFEVLTKELANTYKRIKMYEYQIAKLEDSNNNVSISQKTTQVENVVKEKRKMSVRLKQKLIVEQKVVQQNIKKLESDQKEQNQNAIKQLTEEALFFKERVKQFDKKAIIKTTNMKRQYQAIKKLENQLLEDGLAAGELEDMKQRSIKGIKKSKDQQMYEISRVTKYEEIQDRTRDHFQSLRNQIVILDKLQIDHEKQMAHADEEKQDAMNKNLSSRNRLLQCENEIQNMEKQILLMKNKIPTSFKPLKPLRSMSSQQTENKPSKIMAVSKVHVKSVKITNKSLSHALKFDEVGFSSSMNSQRFTDRNMLGKSNLSTKITGIKVYYDKSKTNICGVQCTYNGHKKGGDYVKRDKETKQKQYIQDEYVCKEKCFIKQISGTLSPNDKLESMTVITSDGSTYRFGSAKTTKKSFSLEIDADQYPACIFGSLSMKKQGNFKDMSEIEHFGVEINKDKNLVTSINEFNQ